MNTVKGLADCHTHAKFSFDTDADVDEIINAGIKKELLSLTITDHCEINRWYEKKYYGENLIDNEDITYNFKEDFEGSVSTITSLKEKYADKIKLLAGVELSGIFYDYELSSEVASDKRLDCVIGSIHELKDKPDFALIDYNKLSDNEIYTLLEKYFITINEITKWDKFDILGHLTYPIRYIEGQYNRNIDISRFDDIIADSFKILAQNGKAIEINTSGLKNDYKKTFPEQKYVKMFRDLHGEIITIGSDAHAPEHIGYELDKGAQIALNSGFEYISYFENRQPKFIKIK